jgi:hypothetical protein
MSLTLRTSLNSDASLVLRVNKNDQDIATSDRKGIQAFPLHFKAIHSHTH